MRSASLRRRAAAGSTTSNVEPAPGAARTVMSPPHRRTKFKRQEQAEARCRPARRLKNGSKIRAWCSGRDAAAVIDHANAHRIAAASSTLTCRSGWLA